MTISGERKIPSTPDRLGIHPWPRNDEFPKMLGVHITKRPKALGSGQYGEVYPVTGKDGSDLVIKVQDSYMDREVLFAKTLEYAQKKNLIPNHIRFVPVLKATTSGTSYIDNPNVPKDVFTMPRMKCTLDQYCDVAYDDKVKLFEQLVSDADHLAKFGFNIMDMKWDNVLIDNEGTPHIADFGRCSIIPHSLAAQCFEEVRKDYPDFSEDVLCQHDIYPENDLYNYRSEKAQKYYKKIQKRSERKSQMQNDSSCTIM